MKELSREEQALKELIEKSEQVYLSFHDVIKVEIPRKPNGLGDTRIHRMESIWHEMSREIGKLHNDFFEKTIESYEGEAYKETFLCSKGRK